MKSRTTARFWRLFDAMPASVQERARLAYGLWRGNPAHPSLQFKRVSTAEPVYSVRIGLSHRALGLLEGDTVTWFWIGAHDEYERLIG
jgi:hypothetical protein